MFKSAVQEISSDLQFDGIIHGSKDKLVVVDFSASWCGPCKMIAPVVDQLSYMYNGSVFLKVDVDKCPSLANRYKVHGVPMFAFFKNASLIHRFEGANSAELESILKLHGSTLPSNSQPTQPASGGASASPAGRSAGINLSSIPASTFGLIPQRGWVLFDAAKPEVILQKLQDSSAKLAAAEETKQLALTAVEGRLLMGLCNTVKKLDSHFLPEQLKLVCGKLLRWPKEIRWPVIDLLRLVVLHPEGAQFVAQHAQSDEDEFNCVDVISAYLLDENSPKELAMMCWRFVCNMFSSPLLQPIAVQQLEQTANIAQLFVSDPTPAVRSHSAAALLNCAVALCASPSLPASARSAVCDSSISLLKKEQDNSNADRLIAALGTALFGAPNGVIESILGPQRDTLKQLAVITKNTSQVAQDFCKFAKL